DGEDHCRAERNLGGKTAENGGHADGKVRAGASCSPPPVPGAPGGDGFSAHATRSSLAHDHRSAPGEQSWAPPMWVGGLSGGGLWSLLQRSSPGRDGRGSPRGRGHRWGLFPQEGKPRLRRVRSLRRDSLGVPPPAPKMLRCAWAHGPRPAN
ncbi:hypothetical protein L345_13992, partial [Ophiophagus hannah]